MMSRVAWTAALCALILVSAGCTNPQGPPGDYGSVAGVVSSSSGPIAGAQVCIAIVECATTASDGTYKITTVPGDPPGINENITASANGYQSFSGQVHISAGMQTPFNITLVHT